MPHYLRMRAHLRLIQESPPKTYSDGYLSGLEHGQQLANTAYIWGGIIAGVLASSFVAWVLL